jgi:hypothetical protein
MFFLSFLFFNLHLSYGSRDIFSIVVAYFTLAEECKKKYGEGTDLFGQCLSDNYLWYGLNRNDSIAVLNFMHVVNALADVKAYPVLYWYNNYINPAFLDYHYNDTGTFTRGSLLQSIISKFYEYKRSEKWRLRLSKEFSYYPVEETDRERDILYNVKNALSKKDIKTLTDITTGR